MTDFQLYAANDRAPVPARAATIFDVARRAGVSTKTVSRVLNNEGRVAEDTLARVRAAVADLDYRPNPNARSLAGRRSYLIGLFYDNPSSNYMADIKGGAIRRCQEKGYHLLTEPCEADDPNLPRLMVSVATRFRLDGLILTPPLVDRQDVLDAVAAANVPLVRIAPRTDPERTAHVCMDDQAAARLAAEHLADLGHHRLGMILGHPDHGAAMLRQRGFQQAAADRGLTLLPHHIVPGDFSFASGFAAAERLLSLPDRPTAIFAGNDDMAAATVAAANKHGLQVPRDLSVVGFDDSPIAQVIWPPLTTIRQPTMAMAAAAVDLLIGDGESEPVRQLDFELMVRQSTGPLPG
ncbi:LacI family DNA-binding transcriptional regulator [Niveispirillum lacus]|uniref:LacI family DNA-binding transcriptional regulator n=1 Tax=Niveispirillum lacus TaxID=1981099 RepID=UPI001FE3402E|nr:LacI family DNA-binding transcriptional regulator [Niveispirillum lacus]